MFNQNKIKSLLEKINWLSDSFQENDFNNVSALEKSLLKEKVLMFYDEIQNIPTSLAKERTITQLTNHVEQKTAPVIEKVNPVQEQKQIQENRIVDVFKELEPKKIESEPIKRFEPKVDPVIKETKVIETVAEKINPVQPIIEKQQPTEISKEQKFQNTEAFQKQVAMPKRDMREIIDLNKSFILKAELFEQNNDSYNQILNLKLL